MLHRIRQRSVPGDVGIPSFILAFLTLSVWRCVSSFSVFLPVSLALVVALHSRAYCRCAVLANEIGVEGAKAIALALEKNSALTNLNLYGNTTIILEKVTN